MRYTPIHILLVEDNAADVQLVNEALRTKRVPYQLTTVSTVKDALDVFRTVPWGSARPNIVVLDLTLGVESGHDVLKQLKSDPSTRCIPIIVLSSSDAERDVRDAYGAYANCYITKPFEAGNFMEVVAKVEDFWTRVAVLPHC